MGYESSRMFLMLKALPIDYDSCNFRAAGILSRPFIDYIEDDCTNPQCFRGMNSQIWHSLQEKMNFTYTIERQTVFGVFKNKTWNGVIGECF